MSSRRIPDYLDELAEGADPDLLLARANVRDELPGMSLQEHPPTSRHTTKEGKSLPDSVVYGAFKA